MTLLEKFYPESRFGGFSDIDGTVVFYMRVNSLLQPSSVVLDVGCGRGEYEEDTCEYRRRLRIFKGKCKKVIGIDVDRNAAQNPYLDEFHLIDGDQWKNIPDSSIDLVVCDYVLEHIEFPDKLFSEFQRVLKPQGVLCARTPNLYSYIGIISNLIPNQFHTQIVTKVQDLRKPEDIFPKFYRCNSLGRIRKTLSAFNFDGVAIGFESEPGYSSFSSFLYRLSKFFHSVTPNYFKTQIHVFARNQKT